MRERPILFSAPMVRAILSGNKTQTRRAAKLPHNNPLGQWEPTTVGGPGVRYADGTPVPVQAAIWHTRTGDGLFCPYGQPGDRLWVREAVRGEEQADGLDGVRYLADNAFMPIGDNNASADAWLILHRYRGKRSATVPPMHMPRWACRLVLEVTRVRVERLNEISASDCWAEGIEECDGSLDEMEICRLAKLMGRTFEDPHPSYAALWEQINGADSWTANPWVWVVEFEPVAHPKQLNDGGTDA
ncbi:hypothetical protein ACOTH0_15480 [Achromobacter xylosoxidans]